MPQFILVVVLLVLAIACTTLSTLAGWLTASILFLLVTGICLDEDWEEA